MAARLVGMPAWQFLDDQAAVLAGGSLTFKDPGTSTDKSIWEDAAKATEHSNPITLDAAGRPPNPVFAEGLYDVTVKDSDGTTVTTISNWGTNFSSNSEQSPNLVCNYSFEDDDDSDNVPDEWTFSGSNGARITSDQNHGAASIKFTGASSSSDSIDSCFIPVSDNCAYEVRAEYKTSNSSATPEILIKQYDDTQTPLGTASQTLWAPSTTQTSWTKTTWLRYTPTSGTKWVKVSIDANTAGTAYNTFFDNVWFKEVRNIPAPGFSPNGLKLSRDAGDTDHDINVTSGGVIADDGLYPLVLESEITKQIDSAWAAGDDAGGIASGSTIPADGILYVWLIGDSDTGDIDVLIDESASSPTMPSGWDKKRYIGGWRTDSSNNLEPGTNIGNYFWWENEIEDITDTTLTEQQDTTGTLTAPPFSVVLVKGNLDVDASTQADRLRFAIKPKGSNYTRSFGVETNATQLDEHGSETWVQVDSSSQFEYNAFWDSQTLTDFKVFTRAWYDLQRESVQ